MSSLWQIFSPRSAAHHSSAAVSSDLSKILLSPSAICLWYTNINTAVKLCTWYRGSICHADNVAGFTLWLTVMFSKFQEERNRRTFRVQNVEDCSDRNKACLTMSSTFTGILENGSSARYVAKASGGEITWPRTWTNSMVVQRNFNAGFATNASPSKPDWLCTLDSFT